MPPTFGVDSLIYNIVTFNYRPDGLVNFFQSRTEYFVECIKFTRGLEFTYEVVNLVRYIIFMLQLTIRPGLSQAD